MNVSRRQFLQTTAVAAALSTSASTLFAQDAPKKKIWANLLHLGYNMWGDAPRAYTAKTDKLRCEEPLWMELTEKMAEAGFNMIVIDIGEGLVYPSHPELAIEGSWSVEKLQKDLERLRKLGLEPIPKLNFSACHDTWMGEYSRMVSTPRYYEVARDLIRDVSEIFDKPRFFHLGYDEETAGHQASYEYVVIRQHELWWHDFLFFVDTVEKQGIRPWIWSDFYWKHAEEFLKRMPKSVLQSNWYYGESFDPAKVGYVQAYLDLDKAGYDQVPAGSNWSCNTNFRGTVEFAEKNLSADHLFGFLQTPWKPTTSESREHHLRAIEQVREMIRR